MLSSPLPTPKILIFQISKCLVTSCVLWCKHVLRIKYCSNFEKPVLSKAFPVNFLENKLLTKFGDSDTYLCIFEMNNPESTKDWSNMSIVDPVKNISSTVEKIDSSATTDYLVKQCESLLENNISKYDECFKQQEDLQLRLIESNEDHACIRSWLEYANKDCLTMKSNCGNLRQTYKILLKNNFVQNFIEHGVGREQLNMKFLTVMMQVENLKQTLSSVNGNMTLLKSEYEKILNREELLQINSTEKTLELVELEKSLRLKAVDVIYDCERLNTHLTGVCTEIPQLEAKHEDLTRAYRVIMQNPVAKEFLDYAKYQENLQSESAEKTNNSESLGDVVKDESDTSVNLQQTEFQEKLMEERQRREEIEKENISLKEFSDKLCHVLYRYQTKILLDKTSQKSTSGFNQNSPVDNNVFSDLNDVNELISSPISKINAAKVNKKKSAKAKKIIGTADNLKEKHDPIVAAVLSSSSNNRKPLRKTKVLQAPIQRRSNKFTTPTAKRHSIVKNSQKLRTITEFYCKICDRYYASETQLQYHRRNVHGNYELKCAVCGNKFASKWSMLRHMLARHTSLRPYKCSFCDRSFCDSSYLSKHLQMVHNEEKNRYCCAHCGQKFLRKQQLFHHICSKHFSGSLEHVKCVTCNEMFSTKPNLTQHCKIHHSKILGK